jgi:hypothetical protein
MKEIMKVQPTGAVVNIEDYAMTAQKLVAQVRMIQEVMVAVMKDGEHYGTIPGCGDKKTLLKPGAEKLATTFRLAPKYEIQITEEGDRHRSYQIICSLLHIPTGAFVGEGVGSCSTLENKYRYRWDNTGKPVPKEYWETRDSSILGGSQYSTRKINKRWFIFEKIEHDNPTDYFNTVLKMAKKRALVDAVLTCTAASDIFTQDVETLPEFIDAEIVPEEYGNSTDQNNVNLSRKEEVPADGQANPRTAKTTPPAQTSPNKTNAHPKDPSPNDLEKAVAGGFVRRLQKSIAESGLKEKDVKRWLNEETTTCKGKIGEMFGALSWNKTDIDTLSMLTENIDVWLPKAKKALGGAGGTTGDMP